MLCRQLHCLLGQGNSRVIKQTRAYTGLPSLHLSKRNKKIECPINLVGRPSQLWASVGTAEKGTYFKKEVRGYSVPWGQRGLADD